MKPNLFFLSCLLAASSNTASGNNEMIRKLSDTISSLRESDWSCAWNNTGSMEACLGDNESCVWCPLTGGGGLCLNSDQGEKLNDAGIPHLKCSDEQTSNEQDRKFWTDLTICGATSSPAKCSQTNTNSGNGCAWCNVYPEGIDGEINSEYGLELTGTPSFGVCLSSEVVDEMNSRVDESSSATKENLIKCSDSEIRTPSSGIFDFKCAMITSMGLPDLCNRFVDSNGGKCIWTNMNGKNLCLSSTQNGIAQSIQGVLKTLGIDRSTFVR